MSTSAYIEGNTVSNMLVPHTLGPTSMYFRPTFYSYMLFQCVFKVFYEKKPSICSRWLWFVNDMRLQTMSCTLFFFLSGLTKAFTVFKVMNVSFFCAHHWNLKNRSFKMMYGLNSSIMLPKKDRFGCLCVIRTTTGRNCKACSG